MHQTWTALADAVAARVRASMRAGEQAAWGDADRVVPPAETLRTVRRHASDLGITRIGLVTGLDRVGLPIAAAFRPNSRSLSVNQGKGRDDVSAMVSAAMEAAEVAVAERPPPLALEAAPATVRAAGLPTIDLVRTTRCRARDIPPDAPLRFVAGHDLIADAPVLVPWDLVGLDHTQLPRPDPFDRSSDGLASGNRLAEAVLRGLHELVERDAAALFHVLPDSAAMGRKRPPSWFGEPWLGHAAARLAAAGIDLALFDVTSDIDVPVAAALLAPRAMLRQPGAVVAGITIGYGSDRTIGGAAARAVAEAAQARVTAIAGARDDIGRDWYREIAHGDGERMGRLSALAAGDAPDVPAPPPRVPAETLWDAIGDVMEAIRGRGIRQVVVVPLTPPGSDFEVCRMIVPGLETGTGGPGRQPGARLLRALLRNAA
jgi:YcaO-like protein with predicted kinase domain